MRNIGKHKDIINAVKFNKKSDLILSGSGDKTIKLWNVSDSSLLLNIVSTSFI